MQLVLITGNIQKEEISIKTVEFNGNLSHDEPLDDKEPTQEKKKIEILKNDRPLTPDHDNNEVFEEITQQLSHLHSTPKPHRGVSGSTPPPSPAEFSFDKDPPSFVQQEELTVKEVETPNKQNEGM